MRVCYLSREYPPQTAWGGIATYTEKLATRMGVLGHEVHVICLAAGPESCRLQDGVWVHRVAQAGLRAPGAGKALGRFFPQAAPHLLWSLAAARRVQKIAADVVEAPEHGGDGFFWSLRHGKRLVVKLHGPMSLCDRHNGRRLRSRDLKLISLLERTSLRRAAAVVSLSAYLGKLVARAWRLEKVPQVVPCPVDVGQHRPVAESRSHGNRIAERTVLFVGRLERRKGVDVLVRAFSTVAPRYPGWRLRLVGAGTEPAAWVCEQTRNSNERVEMIGRLEGAALARAYQQAGVVAVPSRWDNTPAVCLEAMVHGRPVIASRCGGIPEMVRDGMEGVLVEPGNVAQLACALERLMQDQSLRHHMGQAARARVETCFSLDKVAQLTLQVYQTVVG